jgi:hypothetical protein
MPTRFSFKLFPMVVFAVFLIPRVVHAQARTEGQLSGTVSDQSGAVVPNATLELSQPSTGFSATRTSNADGQFTFADLQPGTYNLTVNAKGFAPTVYEAVVVYTGRMTDLEVSLKVGTTAATVEVSAAGEVLETSTNTLATTVSTNSIQDLPLNGRDVLPFAQLMAGAQVGGDLRFTTYNSLPNGAINISVDGANNNFQRFRTSTTGFYEAAALRVGAIDELTVSTSDLTADAGAEGAVTLRFVTKRGTNQYHGGGFWQAYNSAFNANSFQNDAYLAAGLTQLGRKQPFHTNDFGGNIGGPILKNKLFFFFNYERENQPGTGIFTQGVLTPFAQAGNFTYTRTDTGQQQTVNLFNIAANAPASIGGPFPSAINSNIQTLINDANAFAQKGTLTPNTTDAYLQSLQGTLSFTAPQLTKQRWPTGRLDYLIKPNVAWHVSYDLYWREYPKAPVYPGDSVYLGGFKSSYSTFSTGVDWTISPRLVNQANFGILNTQERGNPAGSFDAFKGIPFLPVAPGFVNGPAAITPPVPDSVSILPEPRNNPVWNTTDNLTWTRGKHTFTFGGEFRYSLAHDVGTQPPIAETLGISGTDPAAGMFNTAPVAGCTMDTQGCFPGGLSSANNNEALQDAEALYTTLVGRVSSISGLLPLDVPSKSYKSGGITLLKERQMVGGFYFQDAWKVTPHLAFNFGFRWQFSGALLNTDDYFTGPTFADLLGPSTALFQPGTLNGVANPQIELRTQPYSGDKKQPAPNFGFAWNPVFENGILGKLTGGGSLVIRGAAAVSHYDEGWTSWEQAATGPLFNESVFLNAGQFSPGSISFDPTGASLPPLHTIPPNGFQLPVPEAALTFTGPVSGAFSTVNPKIRSPYVENWTFGVERKLPGNWVIEMNYVGNHSVHMWELYDLNEVNIFQNISGFDSFVQDFKNAQLNFSTSGGTTFAGPAPTPILTQAFAGSAAFTNPAFLFYVQSGQAGALAGAITQNPTFFCNLVGNTFSPCVTQGYNLNAPSPLAYPINFFQLNPYAEGATLNLLSDPGSESYNGLQLQLKHPVGHGLNFMANYTFSHSFTNRYLGDFNSADGALVDFTTLRNPKLNRVPSPYDLRHVFRTYFTYDLPFGTGKAFKTGNSIINDVIGNWSVGSIFTWQIGRDFKLAGGQNTYNYFDSPNPATAIGTPGAISPYVPDSNDSGVVLNGISRSQLQGKVGVYYTGNAFSPVSILPTTLFGPGGAIQPASTPGELGQAIFLHGPMLVDTDISIIKNIPIWERVRFNIYAELVNAFNHPNFNFTDSIYSGLSNNPAQYLFVNSAPYAPGTVQQNGNRQVQFRLQLAF